MERCLDPQAGIWLYSVAPSPIIILPHSFMVYLSLPKILSFLKCVHAQCRVHFINNIEFYFQLRHLLAFPVLGQLRCACQAEVSTTIFSGNVVLTSFLRMSSFLRLSSFLMTSSFFNPTSYGILESRYLTGGGGLRGPP